MKFRLFLLSLLFLYTQAFAFEVDELLDVWNIPNEETTVEIEEDTMIESQEYEIKQEDKFNIVEFLNFEGDCYVTQDEQSHHTKKGGSMFALDISCKDKSFMIARVPQYITGGYYVGRIGTDKYLGDYITLNFGDGYTLVYGHTENIYNLKEGDRLIMGNAIGKANISGKSTGLHFHIELFKNGKNITFDLLNENENSYKLRKQRGWLTEEEQQQVVTNTNIKSSIKEYLDYCGLTDEQQEVVLSLSKTVANSEHYIKWFAGIFKHENGGEFIDGQTHYLAGRRKPSMKKKSFSEQAEGWATTYNKYRYNNNTVSDWLDKSGYCTSDTHNSGFGCPNWKNGVGAIVSRY